MSTTTRSPGIRRAAVGCACGRAERVPAATMVSKLGFSAPRRRMRYSSSAARSRSLTPGFTRATVCSKARELVSTLRRMRASSAADFTMRSSSIQPMTGSSEARNGRRDLMASKRSQVTRARSYSDLDESQFRGGFHHAQFFDPADDGFERGAQWQARLDGLEEVAGHAGGLVANPLDAGLTQRRQHIHHQRSSGDTDLAGGFLRGLDLVARIREQDASPRKNQQGAARAGEAGEIAQVGAEGYQQAIQFAAG